MSLIGLLVVLLICGLLFWLIDYLPVQAPFNKLAKVVLVVVLIVYLLQGLGLTHLSRF